MKNKEQPIIVGLDIGTTKVVVIAGRKNEFGKLEILGFGHTESKGVTHGRVLNIEQCVECISQAVDNCIKSNPQLVINEVYVGIAGDHIKSFRSSGTRIRQNVDEEISQADVDMLIKDQHKTYIPAGDKIIDVVPQDFTVDSIINIMNPVGMSGVKISANFHIITGDIIAIKNIYRCVNKADLKAVDLVLQPLASAASVMHEEDLEAGVAIVDIGGGTTDMAVFYDGILKQTVVFPFAGVNLTEDIRKGLGVLRSQAEQMKIQFGGAIESLANPNAYITIPGIRGLPAREISAKSLAQIIEARMTEVLDYVLLNLQQIGLDNQLYGGIILTGGGAKLRHIQSLTELTTGMNVRIGKPDAHLTGLNSEILMDPMYATCIGLILRGYHDYETGKVKYSGDGNIETLSTHVVVAPTPAPLVVPPIATETIIPVEEPEIPKPDKHEKVISRMFGAIRENFFKLFEETESDREM